MMLSVVLCAVVLLCMIIPAGNVDAALATGKEKWVGNIWAGGNMPTRFGDYWNQLTPENSTKWGPCEPQQGNYNFSAAKAMYNYCKTNKIPFKFHTLVWGSQYPNWLNNLSGSARKAAVENWIKVAAQNFPDAEFIDVVNEAMPGHAPFPFKNDIGGDNGLYGTGWDWIVWSFEMARKYFPNSKLLLNDYNVLNEWSCLDTYIKVVNILKARNLIDGVGCQSHGLENTSAANLKQRLDRLAATGVPIYISELDINIADDNQQKNKMQELFPVMYEHWAVKGITIWGYVQGQTWIPNSHLLRSNGTERPALVWLKEYMANVKPATPTPAPTPRTAFAQIEAESFNSQSGVEIEACSEGGSGIGYIENGDYIGFQKIDFGSGANSFQARVASQTSGGTIELRIDSPTGQLIGTCQVSGTGGWQTWTNVTCSLDGSGVSGLHDLYLKFTGGSGYLFNINWFKFSANAQTTPNPTPISGGNKGDLNEDGKVNSIDFALLRLHLLGEAKLSDKLVPYADVNGDGSVNSIDFGMFRQFLLGIINTFPGQSVTTPTPVPTPTKNPTPTPTQAAAKFHCFLLLGQSNMAGYAAAQASDKVEDPRVLVLGYDDNPKLGRVKDKWDVACPPLHPAWLDAVGPGDWFGKTMIQKVPAGDTIGLIPCAISGEKIETFMKNGGSKYSWIVNRAKIAQQSGGVIEGIIFHQGESNNGDPNWPGKVKTLVEDLRKDLNLGNVPFIAGELLYSGSCAGHNKLVNQLPSMISNCYVVSAEGLVVDPSDTAYRLHFSHDSTVTLGKRYAEKMIQALGW